jgi:hypothetical protein
MKSTRKIDQSPASTDRKPGSLPSPRPYDRSEARPPKSSTKAQLPFLEISCLRCRFTNACLGGGRLG